MQYISESAVNCEASHANEYDVLNSGSDSDDNALGNLFVSEVENYNNNNNNSNNVNNAKGITVELYPVETLLVDRGELMREGVGKDEMFNTLYNEFDGFNNIQQDSELTSLLDQMNNVSLQNVEQLYEQEYQSLIKARVAAKYAFESALQNKVCSEWTQTKTNLEMNVHYRNKRHSLWGHKLWNAAKYLAKRIDSGLIDVFNKRVLELGAGLGVPSLVSYLNGAQLTVITDYPDEELLEILRMNVKDNCKADKLDKRALYKYATLFAHTEKEEEHQEEWEELEQEEEHFTYDEARECVRAKEIICTKETKDIEKDEQVNDIIEAPMQEKLNTYMQCHVYPLLWGNSEHINKVLSLTTSHPHNGDGGFDCIFLSDILFNHICNDDLVRTVVQLLRRDNNKKENAAAYCVFSHHRPHKQLQDYQFFDKCVAQGLRWTLLDEVTHSYPLMFAEDKGPEHVRQPVKCYKLTLASDLAGLPIDLHSCIKYESNKPEQQIYNNEQGAIANSNINNNTTSTDDNNNYKSNTTVNKLRCKKRKNAMIDVVINGTGPVQSYLSAALARSRCNVLHIDGSAHYGGALWTLSLIDFHNYLTKHTSLLECVHEQSQKRDACEKVKLSLSSLLLEESDADARVPHMCASPVIHINHLNTLSTQEQARFQIDMLPSIYMASGDTINHLISSDTAHYLEFQNCNQLCFLIPSKSSVREHEVEQLQSTQTSSYLNNTLVNSYNNDHNNVNSYNNSNSNSNSNNNNIRNALIWNVHDAPLTRSAVFASSLLSLLDKRRLMKFVKDIADVIVEQHHALHSNLSDDPHYHTRKAQAIISADDNHDNTDDRNNNNNNNNNKKSEKLEHQRNADNDVHSVISNSTGIINDMPKAVRKAIDKNSHITLELFLREYYKLSDDAIDVLTLFGAVGVINEVAKCNVSCAEALHKEVLLSQKQNEGKCKELNREVAKSSVYEEHPCKTEHLVTRVDLCHVPLIQSIHLLRQMLFSVNRFNGPTPFLFPCYGCGEVVQGMCRNSAVFGSTFVLRRSLQRIAIASEPTINSQSEECESEEHSSEQENLQYAVMSNGQHIPAKVIITPEESTSQINVTLLEWKHILHCGNRLPFVNKESATASITNNDNNNNNNNNNNNSNLPLTLHTMLTQYNQQEEHGNNNNSYNKVNQSNSNGTENKSNDTNDNSISTDKNMTSIELESEEDKTNVAIKNTSTSYCAFRRIVVVTRTPLFYSNESTTHNSLNIDEMLTDENNNDESATLQLPPLVVALVKIPSYETNTCNSTIHSKELRSTHVTCTEIHNSDNCIKSSSNCSNRCSQAIYIIQQSKTSEQAPATITREECKNSVINVTTAIKKCETYNSTEMFAENNKINTTAPVNLSNGSEEDDKVGNKTNTSNAANHVYYGPSVLHFIVDANYMTQEQLYTFAMTELLPPLYQRNICKRHHGNSDENCILNNNNNNNNDNNNMGNDDSITEFYDWVIYCASFTLSAESIANAMQVSNSYAPQSETLKTDNYSINDNLKVERAIQHQRERLLGLHRTQRRSATQCENQEDEVADDNNTKEYSDDNNSSNDCNNNTMADDIKRNALQHIEQHMCVFTLPSLLPNLLDDGAYMRKAKEIYDKIMQIMHNSNSFLAPIPDTDSLQ